jgi:hypothetical protein
MSNTSIVYGYIASFMWRADADWKLLWKLNRQVVSGFIDAREPAWLTGLFAVPHIDAWECTWQYQIIHFGGSYKDVSVRWDDWLVQFEQLLAHYPHTTLRQPPFGSTECWIQKNLLLLQPVVSRHANRALSLGQTVQLPSSMENKLRVCRQIFWERCYAARRLYSPPY